MGYDFRVRSDASILYNTDPSLTRQEFRVHTDVDNVIKKYAKNGINPFLITKDAKFGDFTSVPSYQEALDLVNSAAEHFMKFDAIVRRRFDNDPGKLLQFLSDPNNRAEALSLGLLEKPKEDAEKKSPASPVVKGGEAVVPA